MVVGFGKFRRTVVGFGRIMYTGFGQQLGVVEPFADDDCCIELGRVVVAIGRRRGSKPEEPGSATKFGRTMVAHTTQCNQCNPCDGQSISDIFHRAGRSALWVAKPHGKYAGRVARTKLVPACKLWAYI